MDIGVKQPLRTDRKVRGYPFTVISERDIVPPFAVIVVR